MSLISLSGLTLFYFVTAKLGLVFAAVSPSATAVWPPSGIALAALLLLGYRVWPAIFVGAFVANITTAGSVATSLGIAAGNTLEGVAGAYCVARWAHGAEAFDRTRDLFRFVGLAALASTTISATIGVTSLALGGYAPWAAYGSIWLTWWLGDATGDLIVAPLLVLWARNRSIAWSRSQVFEAAILLGAVVIVGAVAFAQPSPLGYFPLAFLSIPPLLWAAFRFGPRETATATVLMTAIAVWGALRILDPLPGPLQNNALLLLQVLMATISVTALSVATLVWDRWRADQARGRLAAIVESSDAAILSKTLDGLITSWNPAAERMFGWTADEAIGRSILLIIPEERRAEEDELLARIRRGEIVDFLETVRVAKDGRRLDVSVNVSPVKDVAGRIIGASKIARDITEHKRAADDRERLLVEALAARREAEAATRARDQFLAMLGHELRNPLGAIASALSVIRAVGKPNAPPLDRALDVMSRQVSHLSRYMDDLLDAGRVMGGMVTLVRAAVDLGAEAERTAATLETTAPGRKVVTVCEAVWVDGDVTRIDQIITNLLSNALKFTQPDETVELRVTAEEGSAVLTVTDTGAGIDADLLPRVFDLFVQAGKPLHRSQGGLGVGLTLVRKLVELHGGSVDARSAGIGRGSTFVVRLPRIAAPADRTGPTPRDAPRRERRRVLVIDDEPDGREMIATYLRVAGHQVYEATDGVSGIEGARMHRPDIAIVDIGLPGVDGYAVAQAIREEAYGISLVALTGYGQPEDRDRSREAGFDMHMTKPVDPVRLLQLIDELTSRAMGESPPTNAL